MPSSPSSQTGANILSPRLNFFDSKSGSPQAARLLTNLIKRVQRAANLQAVWGIRLDVLKVLP
jgi:hypothetical protein